MLHEPANPVAAKDEPADLAGAGARPGFVARVRQRLFPASSAPGSLALMALPGPSAGNAVKASNGIGGRHAVPSLPKQRISLQASLAELLLVNRLRARSQPGPSARVLERAAHIIFVTCQNWFGDPHEKHTRHETRL